MKDDHDDCAIIRAGLAGHPDMGWLSTTYTWENGPRMRKHLRRCDSCRAAFEARAAELLAALHSRRS